MRVVQCGGTTLGQVRCDQLAGHSGAHSRSFPSGLVQRWTDEDTRRELAEYQARGGVI